MRRPRSGGSSRRRSTTPATAISATPRGFNEYGKLKASFQWDQIPFFYSVDTRTPFTSPSTGVFRLNDAFQTAVQSAAATNAIYASDMRRFDLRSQRNTADARLDYRATPRLDLRMSFASTARTGAATVGRVVRPEQRRGARGAGRPRATTT